MSDIANTERQVCIAAKRPQQALINTGAMAAKVAPL